MSDLLAISLNDTPVGKLILAAGDKIYFTFDESYLNDHQRPVLSQSFINREGGIITQRPTQTKLPPFFSNLLPEGHLRNYLAQQGGIHPQREFKLIELLGEDLPGAVRIKSLDGMLDVRDKKNTTNDHPYRFSLAGIQLKFSALMQAGGLTIPAGGVGGDWIVKLPAQNFSHVPENEWSMLDLAKKIGIIVPEFKLIDLKSIADLPELGIFSEHKALAVKRFDRGLDHQRIHIEDFAQIYNLFPTDKYDKLSYNNMANLIWRLIGEAGLLEFIKRLVFTVIIGNGDMHAKNWSLIYPDGRKAKLAPAYDFVSTIPYMPNDKLALTLGDTKDMAAVTLKDYQKLIQKAQIPEHIVIKTIEETKELIFLAWNKNKTHYPLSKEILRRIDKHIQSSFKIL